MTKTENKIVLKPLGDRVLAKREEENQSVKGGIILPDSAKEKPQTATVLAVGPGKEDPMPVSVGDKILLDKYAGQEVTIDDETYIIARADDIIAIVQ